MFVATRRAMYAAATMVAMYFVYAWTLGPMFAPKIAQNDRVSSDSYRIVDAVLEENRQELTGLFAEGSWQLNSPNVIDTDYGKLLLQEYETIGDDKLKLVPCTLVIFPKGRGDSNSEQQGTQEPPLIIDAPDGAELIFDGPTNLTRGDVGKLESGRLLGQVTIRRAATSPDARDQLFISTRNVHIRQDGLLTPNEVTLYFGPHRVKGRDFKLWLDAAPSTQANKMPEIRGVKGIELVKLDELIVAADGIALDEAMKPAAPTTEAGRSAINVSQKQPTDTTQVTQPKDIVRVRSAGPLLINLDEGKARLERQVIVERFVEGKADSRLDCEFLTLEFTPPPKHGTSEIDVTEMSTNSDANNPTTIAESKSTNPLADTQLQAVEASGQRVVLTVYSQPAQIIGERLRLELPSRKVSVSGQQSVELIGDSWRVHAKSFEYTPSDTRTLGTLQAEGPGRVRLEMEGGKIATAAWNDHLHLREVEGEDVLSLYGGAALGVGEEAGIQAKELHCWLRENDPPVVAMNNSMNNSNPTVRNANFSNAPRYSNTSGTPAQPASASALPADLKLQIDRALALHEVRIQSPQIDCRTNRLELWVEQVSALTGANTDLFAKEEDSLVGNQAGPQQEAPPYRVGSQSIRLKLRQAGGQVELDQLSLSGSVTVQEPPSPPNLTDPAIQPIRLSGNDIDAVTQADGRIVVRLTGNPLRIVGRGMAADLQSLNVDHENNRAWVEGAGVAEVLLPKKENVRPPRQAGTGAEANLASTMTMPERVRMQWTSGATFDGQTMVVRGKVYAQGGQTQAQMDEVRARLLTPIQLANMSEQAEPEVETVTLVGNVFIQNQRYEGDMLVGVEQTAMPQLDVHLLNGDVVGQGPGWLKSVRQGGREDLFANNNSQPRTAPRQPSSQPTGLESLKVNFSRNLTGNFQNRNVRLLGDVQAVIGPVSDWGRELNPDVPGGIGPKGVIVNCRQLDLAQVQLPGWNKMTFEVAAEGNAVVETQEFTAKGGRLSYSEAKDLMVLSGGQPDYAQLWRSATAGGPKSKAVAEKILYWRNENRLEVENAREFDLSNLTGGVIGGGRNTVAPAPRPRPNNRGGIRGFE
jgi:hypothetical protein